MKVLIVDDDRVVADVLSFAMRRAGYETILAYDGQTALERWQAEAPDLIILDLNLPRLSGFEVCKRIRAAEAAQAIPATEAEAEAEAGAAAEGARSEKGKTPIIILSVRDSQEDIEECRKLGANDYMIKPFSPRHLIAHVQAICAKRETGASIEALR
jgi:DNA-binding response OmpR family regulator